MKRWGFPFLLLAVTCFGVFVLPFLLPPPSAPIVSMSNIVGFNNKLSSVAAALIGIAVFFVCLRHPQLSGQPAAGDYGPLSRRLVAIVTAVFGSLLALLCHLISLSHTRYLTDAGYIMHQISMYADYGRKLYDQIEFPYGPLIFYAPVAVRAVLSPLHITATGAYFITLIAEHVIGLLLVAWVINSLPIQRRWKTLFFLLCAVQTLQLNFGLNYTFFRFILPAAFIVLASKQRRPLPFAAALFAGQVFCLAVSPEMGFAFAAASIAYAGWNLYTLGRAWLIGVVSPFLATALFFLLAGGAYLRMLRLFAGGVYNFVVEPLPHILLFLFALVWLTPAVLALFFRHRREEFPLLAALYIVSLALLPVALGRADPGHVFFNGIPIYLLSLVAISYVRPRLQTVWAALVAVVLLWTVFVSTFTVFRFELQRVVVLDILYPRQGTVNPRTIALLRKIDNAKVDRNLSQMPVEYEAFDIAQLQAITGDAPVATPIEVPLVIEEPLRRSGQYVPSFYCFNVAILDATAEKHAISELNASRWMLVPHDPALTLPPETPAESGHELGFSLPYPARRTPYVIGLLFDQNLKSNWQLAGKIGSYEVYRRR